jgi:hypothetical protein
MNRSSDIIRANRNLFVPTTVGYTDHEVPDSMIASAATAVGVIISLICPLVHILQIYAGLSEWRTGFRQAMDFSANSFSSVYTAHIALLTSVERENPRAYHRLKAKLFKDVS